MQSITSCHVVFKRYACKWCRLKLHGIAYKSIMYNNVIFSRHCCPLLCIYYVQYWWYCVNVIIIKSLNRDLFRFGSFWCTNLFISRHRVTNKCGVKTFSTSSSSLCEKKNDQYQKTQAVKEGDQAEVVELKEEPAVLKADDGDATQQQTDVKTEQAASKQPAKTKNDAAKSGKESLLNLLGAMKVEVTNKRKLKNLKAKQSYESVTQYKPKAAPMESTISMYQKATGDDSSQRWEKLEKGCIALLKFFVLFTPLANKVVRWQQQSLHMILFQVYFIYSYLHHMESTGLPRC